MRSKSQLWTLYQKATRYSKLPSELLRLEDEWLAYQFDNAVTLFGTVIENALGERRNAGSDKQPDWQPKYTLPQLLDDAFRLPAPVTERPQGGLAGLMNTPGVKVFKAK